MPKRPSPEYKEGRAAYRVGLTVDQNPYPTNSRSGRDWLYGWYAGDDGDHLSDNDEKDEAP